MMAQIVRMAGKTPHGFRIALLAQHENLVCMFTMSSAAHWKYINQIDEKWPTHWDMAARMKLEDRQPARSKKAEVVIVPPAKEDKSLDNIIDILLLEDTTNAGQQTSSRDFGDTPTDGEEDYATGVAHTVHAHWEF